ncbi:beta-lactamase-like protein [Cryomyces antarcticus]
MAGDYLVDPKPPPNLRIPESTCTVQVSIIDSTSRFEMNIAPFLQPDIKGKTKLTCPAFSFLIEHSSGKKILFDLGVRKDFENLAPHIVEMAKKGGWIVNTEKNVSEIISENGTEPKDIDAIIWSHLHWDHTGDPSTFPNTTDLIVGPGFKEAFVPAYPKNKDSPLLERDWEGRNLREVSFEEEGNGLKIGRFDAMDFFGDGSFYLLDSPGHAIGHMCGLARTTSSPPTFVLMGGDACHHGGEFRPTEYLPLPISISPSPIPKLHKGFCFGALFQQVQPDRKADVPFYHIAEGFAHDKKVATWSIHGVEEFDAADNVLVAIAHDDTLLDVLDFYPKTLNHWREKDLSNKVRWTFLRDFAEAVEEQE